MIREEDMVAIKTMFYRCRRESRRDRVETSQSESKSRVVDWVSEASGRGKSG